MKSLYTGFKGNHNSSFRLVSALPGDRCFLTNSFAGVKRDIGAMQGTYDAVWMFGLDKTLMNAIRPETCAEESGRILHTSADLAPLSLKLGSLRAPPTICVTRPITTCWKEWPARSC